MPASNNLSAITVGINSQPAVTGARQVVNALQSVQRQLTALQRQLTSMRRGGGGGPPGGGGAGDNLSRNINQVLGGFTTLLNRLRNTLFVAYLLREAFQGITLAFQAMIKAGIEFNAIMEQAEIGVGGLIAQLGKVSENGIELKGAEEITGAMRLAKEEILALQIAGLQTAATTEQLVQAFQTAVGAGLRAGLSLKEIRQLTIDIVQVASSIGLPMHQIAQEVRAILEGTIDNNARVAKVIGITNKEVKELVASGNLAAGLGRKFEVFRDIGGIVEKSFEGAKSNVEELFQVISGMVTSPVFDALKKKMVELTQGVRAGGAKGDITRIEDLFGPDIIRAVEMTRKVFTVAAEGMIKVYDRLIQKVQEFGKELERNPELYVTLAAAIRTVTDALDGLFARIDADTSLAKLNEGIKDVIKFFQGLDAMARIVEGSLRVLLNLFGVLFGVVFGWVGVLRDLAEGKGIREAFANWGGLIKKSFDEATTAGGKTKEAIIELYNIERGQTGFEATLERMRRELGLFDVQLRMAQLQILRFGSTTAGGAPANQFEQMVDTFQSRTTADMLTKLYGTPQSEQESRIREGLRSQSKFVQLAAAREMDKLKNLPLGTTTKELGLLSYAPDKPPPSGGKKDDSKDRAEQIERSRRLAVLQAQEQMRKTNLDLTEKAFDRELAKYKAMVDAKLMIERDFQIKSQEIEEQRQKARVDSTMDAFKRTFDASKAALGEAGVTGLEGLANDPVALMEKLKSFDITAWKQPWAEAWRELYQAAGQYREEIERLAEVQSRFVPAPIMTLADIGGLGQQEEIKEPIQSLGLELARLSSEQYRNQSKVNDLLVQEERLKSMVWKGTITQARAEEEILRIEKEQTAEQIRHLEADNVTLRLKEQNKETSDKILQNEREIAVLSERIFDLSNAESFWKGMRQETETMLQKFEQLGADIKSIFRDAFEEAGRSGIKGFATTFLQGIADLLNTRAADALSKVMVEILESIFSKGGKTQSIFDMLLEQIMGIFGRKPTGKFSIGGILETIFGKIFDPLGKSKQGQGEGLPTLTTTIGEALKKSQEQARAAKEVAQAKMPTDVAHISLQVDEIVRLLQASKDCCDRNNQALQTMAGAKGPGLLGQVLGAMAGAAAGGFIGNLSFGGGGGTRPNSNLGLFDDMGQLVPGSGWGGFAGGGGTGLSGINLSGVQPQNNVTFNINTPNVGSFTAPQTQAQIAQSMAVTLQRSQGLVGGTQNNK